MRETAKLSLIAVLIVTVFTIAANSPSASSGHYVVTNENAEGSNSNAATVFKLGGSRLNPVLNVLNTLSTGGLPSYSTVPNVQLVRNGSDICLFLTHSESVDVAAFVYPALSEVGTYTDPSVNVTWPSLSLIAHGQYLFVGYNDTYNGGYYLASWGVESGCKLTLLNTVHIDNLNLNDLAVSPNGQTLVVTYSNTASGIFDSFSIQPGGSFVEHGPYFTMNSSQVIGVDITKDGKFSIIGIRQDMGSPSTDMLAVLPIDPDGTLGSPTYFSENAIAGYSNYTAYVALSPDERFLYVDYGTDGFHTTFPVTTTLNFTENPLSITYTGCSTTLKDSDAGLQASGMATASPSGSGGALYVSEYFGSNANAVALLAIDSTTGCTTEAPSSPFYTGQSGRLNSIVAWPPRPF